MNRPTTDVLVKRRGEGEHRGHPRDAGGVLSADILVKGRSGRIAGARP